MIGYLKQMVNALAIVVTMLAGVETKPVQMQSGPETVIVTYRPKAGQEAALLDVLSKQWAALRGLQVVEEQPHLVYRGAVRGKVVMTEVLTWVDADDADHLPPVVQDLWKQMQAITESRDGKPGVEIRPVEPVDTARWK